MQINKWLYLSTGVWGIRLFCDLFRERIDQKKGLLWEQLTEFLVVTYSVTNFFAMNFPIFWKSLDAGKKQAIAKCYALQANVKSFSFFTIHRG